MKYLKAKKHIYFIAIGGIGMSAIALVLLKKGFKISGSDLKPNSSTIKLTQLGAEIYPSHKKENIKNDIDLIVYSSCIRKDNPEMQEARGRKIVTVSRGAVLAELADEKETIAVAGCHGKTTTSGMIATILTDAGLDPTALIGGEVNFLNSNARAGGGKYLVTEADESDGSFLKVRPVFSVITNIDEDHMDYFKDTKGLIERFKEYIKGIKKGGLLIYSADDERARLLKKYCKESIISFGLKDTADLYAKNIVTQGCHIEFDCFQRGSLLGRFKVNVPGLHNVSNALAAICAGLKLGLTTVQIRQGLEKFTGTKRRFQIRGCFKGVTVVEDYAHHPSEITATLEAAGCFKPKRVIGVFQPHRFTRTLHLADRFSKCFNLSDYLILTDIYSASEDAIKGVDARLLYNKVTEAGHRHVVYMRKNKIAEELCRIKRPGDMILVLGAGDINSIADELVKRLK